MNSSVGSISDLDSYLAQNPELKKIFDTLPPSHQAEYQKWIAEAKNLETRQKRIIKAAEMIAAKSNAQ